MSAPGADERDPPAWSLLPAEEAQRRTGTPAEGLTAEEAARRLEEHGPNRIGEKEEVHWWSVLFHQVRSPLVYVLLGALAVTLLIRSFGDAIVIGAVLLINTVVGFLQEFRAERSVQALLQLVARKAVVLRGGRRHRIPAEEVVPGDIVLLRGGDVIPADVRWLQARSLQVDESLLTGESVPVQKSTSVPAGGGEGTDSLPIAERTSMGFLGTAVTTGKARGLVVATGRGTELGAIAGEVEETAEVETPLQRRITRLTQWIAVLILGIALLAFGVGWVAGRGLFEMLLLAVALAVAAIPAGLPIVVTVALAIGVERMARRHAVIRRLPAVDTLGSCTVILSDKTGTLTRNEMTVRALRTAGGEYRLQGEEEDGQARWPGRRWTGEGLAEDRAATWSLRTGALCNDLEPAADGSEDRSTGDPMEKALVAAAAAAGRESAEEEQRFPRVDEIPFRTERRYMATVHRVEEGGEESGLEEDGTFALVKGAPEAVLDLCDRVLQPDGSVGPLDREEWTRQNESMAGEGLRVLAMAVALEPRAVETVREEEPRQLVLVGLQGLLDPPRPSARDSVDRCHEVGIRVAMVTGDHARTAGAIARAVHIEEGPDTAETEIFTGRQIEEASDEELDQVLARVHTFARVEPLQKNRLVERLKGQGEIVAVTGDGVNDAPALKNAHLGAAMGSGTDVAKEASDMVITDDRFSSVFAAVEQGRIAFRNIRMATFFLLSTGMADVLLILGALVLGWPLPLVPAQILWCNVVTNGIADVALAFEPGDKSLLRRPPRPPGEGILNRNLLERLVLVGSWLTVGVLGVFLWKWGFDFRSWSGEDDRLTVARTAALTTMILFQKVHVFNCRSEDVSIFRRSLFGNKLLFAGVLTSLAVHIGALHWSVTQQLLDVTPLDPLTWLVSAAVAATAIAVNELHKKWRGGAR